MQGVGARHAAVHRVAGDRALDGDPGVVPAERAHGVADRVAEEHRVAQRGFQCEPGLCRAACRGLGAAQADAEAADALGILGTQPFEFGAAQPEHLCRGRGFAQLRAVGRRLGAEDGLILGEASDFAAAVAGVRDEQRRRAEGVEQ